MENTEKQPGTHVVQSVTKPSNQGAEGVTSSKAKTETPKKTLPKRHINWLLVSFGILTVLCLSAIGLVEWQRQQFANLQSQRETLVTGLPGETSVTQEQVAVLSSGLLSEEGIISFIETVEQVSGSFAEFEMNFITDVPEGTKVPLFLPVTFTMTGSYTDINNFITALLKSQYIIKVMSLELTSKDGFESSATAILTTRVYVSDDFTK